MSEKFNIPLPSFDDFVIWENIILPKTAGLYIMFNRKKVVKIGQTTNLNQRLVSHEFRKNNVVDEIRYMEIDNDVDRLFMEMCFHYLFLKHKIKFHGFKIRV